MAEGIHELAPHHLPSFITPPGDTDILFVIIAVGVLALIVWIGNFYFKLHALPEKMAHDANSTQLHLVGVLSLLALFTHNNVFWVIALLLAAVRLPDFATPLGAIVDRLGDISSKLEPARQPEAAAVNEAPPAHVPPAPEPTEPLAEAVEALPNSPDDQTTGER